MRRCNVKFYALGHLSHAESIVNRGFKKICDVLQALIVTSCKNKNISCSSKFASLNPSFAGFQSICAVEAPYCKDFLFVCHNWHAATARPHRRDLRPDVVEWTVKLGREETLLSIETTGAIYSKNKNPYRPERWNISSRVTATKRNHDFSNMSYLIIDLDVNRVPSELVVAVWLYFGFLAN